MFHAYEFDARDLSEAPKTWIIKAAKTLLKEVFNCLVPHLAAAAPLVKQGALGFGTGPQPVGVPQGAIHTRHFTQRSRRALTCGFMLCVKLIDTHTTAL